MIERQLATVGTGREKKAPRDTEYMATITTHRETWSSLTFFQEGVGGATNKGAKDINEDLIPHFRGASILKFFWNSEE